MVAVEGPARAHECLRKVREDGCQNSEETEDMTTKIYIASQWVERARMPEVAKQFEDSGFSITHKWWETEGGWEKSPDELRKQAEHDVEGVLSADAVVLVNTGKSEGKAVEQGIAIAAGKPIIAIGTRGEFSLNVFHYLPLYTWVSSVEQAIWQLT